MVDLIWFGLVFGIIIITMIIIKFPKEFKVLFLICNRWKMENIIIKKTRTATVRIKRWNTIELEISNSNVFFWLFFGIGRWFFFEWQHTHALVPGPVAMVWIDEVFFWQGLVRNANRMANECHIFVLWIPGFVIKWKSNKNPIVNDWLIDWLIFSSRYIRFVDF